MGSIAENLKAVRARIASAAGRAGRDPASVTLVAVSKTQGADAIREAMDAGQTVFGENYVQELESKAREIPGATWHMIGHLQSNKAKKVVPIVRMIETVHSVDLAREIGKRAVAAGKIADCLVEVNIGGEASKSGADPGELPGIVSGILEIPGVRLRGLMAIPPFLDPEAVRPYFSRLHSLLDGIRNGVPGSDGMTELSMGMSSDFETAVSEGATIVRVGTAIFGERS